MSETMLFGPPTLALMGREELARKLEECGEVAAAAVVSRGAGPQEQVCSLRDWFSGRTPKYLYPTHAFGFIGRGKKKGPIQARAVENIPAEPELKHTTIDITLDAFRIAEYPGRGQRQ